MKPTAALLLACLSLLLTSCMTDNPAPDAAPNVASSAAATAVTRWPHGAMATAANPYAVDAAIAMLARGGHAVDAAIAAHAVLGLVEPQSSGLGGGGFMLVHEHNADLTFYDGREMAPLGAAADMFMQDGKVLPFNVAKLSGMAVGVPGAVALYARTHEVHGRLPWASLFEPAMQLAEDGFIVSPRLAGYMPYMQRMLAQKPDAALAAYFLPEGIGLKAGDRLENPAYAQVLQRIASEGASAFYQGDIAGGIVDAARAAPLGGSLTRADLAAYQVIERPVICGGFRALNICTTSPPSSGAAQIMIPAMYDEMLGSDASPAARIAAFVDAQRLAYADRDYYFGDPDSVDVPIDELLNPVYLKHRAGQRFAPGDTPVHGDPGEVLVGKPLAALWGRDTTEEVPGTTHLSIIDADGNAVSMTATIEGFFGSGRWTHGFLLNNEMTDFAREVAADGPRPANAVIPGGRPRSSMSPTMVFDASGNLMMVTGSPGGNNIPAYVAKTILGVLDWGLDAQAAADFPNIIARDARVKVEIAEPAGKAIAEDLTARGYDVWERDGENSGLHLIVVTPEGLDGAADKRREGTVTQLPRL